MHLWNTFPSHPSIMSFLLGVHLYPKTCIKFLSHLGSSSGLYSCDHSPLPPIIGGFSQIALISLPPVSICLLLSVSLPPPSLQILMSARSIMEAASTDVLTPGAPTTVNATRALACMWTVAPASVRNITAFLAVLTLYKLENNSYVSAH